MNYASAAAELGVKPAGTNREAAGGFAWKAAAAAAAARDTHCAGRYALHGKPQFEGVLGVNRSVSADDAVLGKELGFAPIRYSPPVYRSHRILALAASFEGIVQCRFNLQVQLEYLIYGRSRNAPSPHFLSFSFFLSPSKEVVRRFLYVGDIVVGGAMTEWPFPKWI